MTVYEYIADSDKFDCLTLKSTRDEKVADKFAEGKPLAPSWRPIAVVSEPRPKKAGDFPSLFGYMPVFSQRAWDGLRPLISTAVEALPIKHPSGEPYFAINVVAVVDALDLKKSKVVRYPTGQVMAIEEYVFMPKKLAGHHLFKIPESKGREVLLSEEFRQRVAELKLKGLLCRERFRSNK